MSSQRPNPNLRCLVAIGSVYPEVVKLVGAINRASPTWDLLGFIDDRPECVGTSILGYPVLGDRSVLPGLVDKGVCFVNNVSGKACNARAVAALLDSAGAEVVNLVHPSVDLAYVGIGRGCILPEGCVVGTSASIGSFLSARLHVVISHHVVIEDFVFIGPGAVLGSHVHVEANAFIGAGATIMSGCRIGRNSVVGAAALVTEDVPPDVTVAGIRARTAHSVGRL